MNIYRVHTAQQQEYLITIKQNVWKPLRREEEERKSEHLQRKFRDIVNFNTKHRKAEVCPFGYVQEYLHNVHKCLFTDTRI